MCSRFHLWYLALAAILLLGCSQLTGLSQAFNVPISQIGNPAGNHSLGTGTNDFVMVDFTTPESLSHLVTPKDFTVTRQVGSAVIAGPMTGKSQSIAIAAGAQPWDLSGYLYVAVDVHNGGARDLTIICRAEDPEYAGWHHFAETVARIGAGQTDSVLVFLKRKSPPPENLRALFPGMNALPDGYMPHWSGLDPARTIKIVLGLETEGNAVNLGLLRLRAVGICDAASLTRPDYFPLIDSFGQFRHADWPTKIHSPGDFETQRIKEAAALQASPRPISWDKYGGFINGPKLAASGSFRVEKYCGKWWLIDPDGRLFWSHGVTGVGFNSPTPLKGRENFFSALPVATENRSQDVNWYLENLKLKYGSNAENTAAALAHERLSSWGLNTLASWSAVEVTRLGKTPYTKMLAIDGPKIAPALRLSDPFDEAFQRNARNAFESEKNSTAKDPWCIGYFIGNELEWRGGPEMVDEILTAVAKEPGKQALVELLQQRHASIENLNAVWHTDYKSWQYLLASTNKIDAKLAADDFAAFNEQLADRYYQICEAELKRAAPNKLNLGSRFHTINPFAVRAAAKYCDVVSFNKYATSVRDLRLPDRLDRPVIIGEFHFPAWDRSFAANAGYGELCERQRADAYWYYLVGALENPLVVGTHWFQYLDQPLTGRGDGENSPIGFVDVTDTPYDELTKVTRELGDSLYVRRLQFTPAQPELQPATKGNALDTSEAHPKSISRNNSLSANSE